MTINSSLEKDVSLATSKLIEDLQAKIKSIHGDYWSQRQETSKTILTITAAFIAITVSFSSSILGKENLLLHSALLLILSLVFLVISVISGVFALWHMYVLSSIRPLFFNKQAKTNKTMIDTLQPLESQPQTKEQYENKLKEIASEIGRDLIGDIEKADKKSHKAVKNQLIFFSIGTVLFALSGIATVIKYIY